MKRLRVSSLETKEKASRFASWRRTDSILNLSFVTASNSVKETAMRTMLNAQHNGYNCRLLPQYKTGTLTYSNTTEAIPWRSQTTLRRGDNEYR
jgi:hypothetical protein